MPLVQRLTEEEWALFEIIRHPAWMGEFIRNFTLSSEDAAWVYTPYQKEMLCDFNSYVSYCCGRTIGKTVTLIDKLAWFCVNNFWPDEAIVYTVPNKVHLEPVFLRLTRWFRQHPFLKHYTGRTGINSQSFTIKLYNNSVIDCRIAGQSGTGANVVGLHVPVIILDEGGFYPWGTWVELLPCLNSWQEGFQLFVSGVPIGMREKNVLFFADQKDTKFTKHRISAHQNPRYAEIDEERNIKQFGGVESEDYIHMVLGEHGTPSYMLFDRSRMRIETYDVFRGTLYGSKMKKDLGYLSRFYGSLPQLPKSTERVMFGIDLGYTDPTVILVMYRTKTNNYWKFLARLTLRQVPYPAQELIIDKLDSMYHPGILGVDEGSSGKAVVQHLRDDPRYRHKGFKDRVIPIQFRSMVVIGMSEDGEETKVRAKQFGMQLLQTKVNNHEICFSAHDETFIGELERTTYHRTPTGEFVFKTVTPRGGLRHGEDHNVSALLCSTIALYLTDEASQYMLRKKHKLYRPRWGNL